MHPTTYLEWWFEGEWRQIGWPATNPEDAEKLREHGDRLARDGGFYRLIHPSHLRDAPPLVIHEWRPDHAASAYCTRPDCFTFMHTTTWCSLAPHEQEAHRG